MKPKLTEKQKVAEANKRLQQHIIRNCTESVRMVLDSLGPDEPCEIENVKFGRDSIAIMVRWPFSLPELTHDAGEYLGTAKSQKRFRHCLRSYLLQNGAGKKLSNVLYGELIESVVQFTHAYRAGEGIVSATRLLGARRLAGRPRSEAINKNEVDRIAVQGREIRPVILKIRSLVNKLSTLEDDALFRRVLKAFNRETYPWMRSFRRALQELHGGRSLKETKTWSTPNLTAQIISREIYRMKRKRQSLGEIKKAINSPRRLQEPRKNKLPPI